MSEIKKVWVKYELTKEGKVPEYIIDGGYSEDGKFLYGVADASKIPDKSMIIKKKDFEDLYAQRPVFKEAYEPLTDEEKRERIKDMFQKKEVED